MSAAVSFRYDINFLRALAVISVLLYHFGVPPFTGGFAGVDVFFVISGFLMGAIICNGLDSQRFSVVNFYIARLKRIVPALIALCVACLICGWFLLAPDDFHTQALHVRDSLLFISNETYRDESGYFDASSHEKWLLHTWSLSVEWQFYLLLPFILWGLKKCCNTPQRLFNTLLLLTLIAFAVCVDKSNRAAENAFFLLKYRCWEMLVGVLVFLLPLAYPAVTRSIQRPQSGLTISFFSLSAITVSVLYFDSAMLWPSWHAALPVVATALIVLVNYQSDLYKSSLVEWFGSRSYSLYLWHWPLVVLLAYFSLTQWFWIGAAILGSMCLAEISFRWIEEPVRKSQLKPWLLALVIIGCAGIVASAAQWVIHNKGFIERVSPEVRKVLAAKNDRNMADKNCIGNFTDAVPSCQFGSDKTDVVVIGDSHAHSLVTGILTGLPAGSGVSYWGYLACPTIANVESDHGCAKFNRNLLERVKELPSTTPVVIASRFSFYPFGEGLDGYELEKSQPQVHFGSRVRRANEDYLAQYAENTKQQLCALSQERSLYVVLPVPELIKLVPQTMARSMMRGSTERVTISMADYQRRNSYILNVLQGLVAECGIHLLDPLPYLCSDGLCFGDKQGRPLYYDDDHLNEFGNKVLSPLFSNILSH